MASSGNFCTLNPLAQPNSGTYSEGNLLFTHTASAWRTSFGTHGMRTGKWYWEAYQYEDITTGNGFPIGIYDQDSGKQAAQAAQYPGQSNSSYGTGYIAYSNTGTYATKRNNGSETNMTIDDGDAGDVWQCAFDADNGKIWFGKNNTWDNSANPALGSNESYASIPSSTWVPITCSYSDSSSENYPQNFGQDSTFAGRISAGGNADDNGFGDFKYAPPTGFLALCSGNLPVSDNIDPAQTDDNIPTKQFNTITWTGNRSSNSTINNITGVGFQPDLVWLKFTEQTYDWRLVDSSRGVTEAIRSNQTTVEQTEANGLYQFGSDGFSVKGDNNYNYNGGLFIGYCWKANGGTTASNSDGDITSTVQANTDAGFSIVTYTGDGTDHRGVGYGSANIGHGLDSAPEFIITKRRDSSGSWYTYHAGAGIGYLLLESNGTFQSGAVPFGPNAPTATTFGGYSANNNSSHTYICYCWHSVEGYSKFGSYEGNDNTDGPFVYTGFRPRMVCIKGVDEAYSWFVFNSARNPTNLVDKHLRWDQTEVETTEASGARRVDFLSNGFKIRASAASLNGNNDTYVFMAWGDVPFKYNNTF